MKIKNNIDEQSKKIFKQNNEYCKEYIKMKNKENYRKDKMELIRTEKDEDFYTGTLQDFIKNKIKNYKHSEKCYKKEFLTFKKMKSGYDENINRPFLQFIYECEKCQYKTTIEIESF